MGRGEPLLLPGWGSPSHTSRKASSHQTSVSHMSSRPPYPPDMAGHNQKQRNFGLPVPTWRRSQGRTFSFNPSCLRTETGNKTTLSFLLHLAASLKGTRDMMGCLGQEKKEPPRSLPSPLPCWENSRGARERLQPRETHRAWGDPASGEWAGAQGQWFPAQAQPARTACAPGPPRNPNPWGKSPSPSINLPVTSPCRFHRAAKVESRAWPQRPPAVTGLQNSPQRAPPALLTARGRGRGHPQLRVQSFLSSPFLSTPG